jgi:hypothetical protein
MRLEPVRRVLQSLGAPHALIGAHAMAARGYPRFTVDVDLLTSDRRVLDPGVWTALQQAGGRVDARRGDADDPVAGVVHILLPDSTDVDVVVARWKWEADVIERADPMHVADVQIKVPRTSDLILLKLAAGATPIATTSTPARARSSVENEFSLLIEFPISMTLTEP